MEGLTLVTSVSYSDDFWECKRRQMEDLEVGDHVMIGGTGSHKVLGVRNGRIEIEHSIHGPSTVDPMLVTGVVMNHNRRQ